MVRRVLLLSLVMCLLATHLVVAAVTAPEKSYWPQWRGPKRDGLSTDTGLLSSWPKGGPPLLWEAKGAGRGYASLAIVGGKIYTMGDAPSTAGDKDQYILCFDDATGNQLWKTKLGPAWTSGKPDYYGSRSTPTVDGASLYVLTPTGDLVCLETAAGKELWRKRMKDFGGMKADGWGYSESVLIDGDRVICTPGGEKATLVALDKNTGTTIWTAAVPNDRGAGHASVIPATIGSTRIYVQVTGGGPVGVRASDGKVLWRYPIDKTTAVIPTPIVRGDLVFFTVGYNRGGTLLRQVPASNDEVKVEPVYPLNAKLHNKHGGVVLVGDYVYGDTGDGGVPHCIELMTGKEKWKERGSGKGSAAMTYADGHLYIRFADGIMALAPASPEAYKETGSFKIPHRDDRPSWSHPVVTGGKLYLREGDYVLCYDLRAK